jgi:hypothetical protein
MSGPEIPLTYELSQLLSAIVNNAQAGQRFLAGDRSLTKEALEAFADIAADGKRADDAVRRLRELLERDVKGNTATD